MYTLYLYDDEVKLTVSNIKIGFGNIGFFLGSTIGFVFLASPPHSTSTNGWLTGNKWNLFMSRTPQQST